MKSNEFPPNNKSEKKIQSKSIIGKQIQKENEIKNKTQSKKEEDNYIQENNMDYEDQMKDNRDTAQKLEEFIYSSNHDQENNEKKESCKKSTRAKDKAQDNKEKGEMESDANENSFIDGQKIESFPLIKKKKIERKKSKKQKKKNCKKEFKKVKENNSQKDIKKKEEKIFEITKEKKLKIKEKRKNIFEIKKEKNCRKEIAKKKIFKTQKTKTGQKRVKKKKKFETFISSPFYEEMELNEISKVFVNKKNQKYANINIKPVYPELFNFKFPIFDSLFIPQIDNDEEKLNSEDVINVSSNHSRYNMTLNFANEELTNSNFSYHPLFIYFYPTTNYSSII